MSTRFRLQWVRLLSGSAIALGVIIAPAMAQSPEQTETASPPTEPISATQQRAARPTLRLNSEGTPVTELQALLKLLGYYSGEVSGRYGEETQTAVAQFQQAADLSVDGIVGPATWNRLLPSPPSADNPPATSSDQAVGATAEATPVATNPTDTPATGPAEASPVATTAASPTAAAETSSEPPATSESASDSPAPAEPTPARTNTNPPVELPVLKQGMYGPAVARLQQRLQALGFYRGAIDGIFGPATEQAVQQAQRQYRLTPDGIVGAATWSALLR
ncbi:peptidoglycan-binding protein [Sphaerothrix gracilis]|uniref:peptidoglycan-binding protein n=1 Tax=Sphaerothrix gracilis TaxID=3151835 RepID=UPI0031FC5F12